jgi:hypothetical protein
MPLLLTTAGPMVGTAGWMGGFPFTGETEELLPCCGCCGTPTATGGAAPDEATGGDETCLVALAYERAAFWDEAMGGFCALEAGALMKKAMPDSQRRARGV